LRQAKPDLEKDGATILRSAVAPALVSAIVSEHGLQSAGKRQFSLSPAIMAVMSADGPLTQIAMSYLGSRALPVRAIIFDKTPGTNWALGWHQDRTVALKERVDVLGYTSWNTKAGVPHAEPPTELLARMLTLRLFLDDCDETNGPLEIALGTHRLGRVPHSSVAEQAEKAERFIATGEVGDVLVMRLLTIHASGRSQSHAHRRVLHVDYAADKLPSPLQWAMAH
jgi:ectoine hydroxylase-related dioxygenase (phytanoyl-CoA dioxygenase family)